MLAALLLGGGHVGNHFIPRQMLGELFTADFTSLATSRRAARFGVHLWARLRLFFRRIRHPFFDRIVAEGKLLLGRVKQGEGPDEARRAKSWFTVDFVGEGDGRTVHTRVSGGDPGYDETAKMLAESALCLAFDDNPPTAGCVTTAQAMGERLLDRLVAAGIRFETL